MLSRQATTSALAWGNTSERETKRGITSSWMKIGYTWAILVVSRLQLKLMSRLWAFSISPYSKNSSKSK